MQNTYFTRKWPLYIAGLFSKLTLLNELNNNISAADSKYGKRFSGRHNLFGTSVYCSDMDSANDIDGPRKDLGSSDNKTCLTIAHMK